MGLLIYLYFFNYFIIIINNSGSTRIIMSLLQCPKIETNIVNTSGSTPFHYFCQTFSSPSSLRKVTHSHPLPYLN